MIIQEIFEEKFTKTYSDKGFMIKQKETGVVYEEAIDGIPCRYTYEETDILINEEDGKEVSDEKVVEELMQAMEAYAK